MKPTSINESASDGPKLPTRTPASHGVERSVTAEENTQSSSSIQRFLTHHDIFADNIIDLDNPCLSNNHDNGNTTLFNSLGAQPPLRGGYVSKGPNGGARGQEGRYEDPTATSQYLSTQYEAATPQTPRHQASSMNDDNIPIDPSANANMNIPQQSLDDESDLSSIATPSEFNYSLAEQPSQATEVDYKERTHPQQPGLPIWDIRSSSRHVIPVTALQDNTPSAQAYKIWQRRNQELGTREMTVRGVFGVWDAANETLATLGYALQPISEGLIDLLPDDYDKEDCQDNEEVGCQVQREDALAPVGDGAPDDAEASSARSPGATKMPSPSIYPANHFANPFYNHSPQYNPGTTQTSPHHHHNQQQHTHTREPDQPLIANLGSPTLNPPQHPILPPVGSSNPPILPPVGSPNPQYQVPSPQGFPKRPQPQPQPRENGSDKDNRTPTQTRAPRSRGHSNDPNPNPDTGADHNPREASASEPREAKRRRRRDAVDTNNNNSTTTTTAVVAAATTTTTTTTTTTEAATLEREKRREERRESRAAVRVVLQAEGMSYTRDNLRRLGARWEDLESSPSPSPSRPSSPLLPTEEEEEEIRRIIDEMVRATEQWLNTLLFSLLATMEPRPSGETTSEGDEVWEI
ncbi:hypothetical protein F5X99DRAFT_412061 [Biscogniauxia marginata]|nr:hypothetical protein F5X99DRAFT_412061 [Biscogniauxia marginata]